MSLRKKIYLLFSVLLLTIVGFAIFFAQRTADELINLQARKMASTVATQVITDCKHYVQGVVVKVKGMELGPKAEGGCDPKGTRVPLPAEFVGRVARDVRESQSEYEYSLVSLWNINKDNALSDDFLKRGFAQLREQEAAARGAGILSPSKPFTG